MKITVCGGDRRMQVAYKILKADYDVCSVGLFEGDCNKIPESDIILLPVPTTRDSVYVNCSLSKKKIPLEDIEKLTFSPLVLSAGYKFKSVRQIDYAALDEFCIKNAVPTAEGAIAAAISDTPFTLFDSAILVTGYGRIGKVLAKRLESLCKNLTVSARKHSDFALLDSLNIKSINTAEVAKNARKFDIIFNTLDIPLFDDLKVFKERYLFDLSTKGCVDYGKTTDEKIKKLPSLPGKTAPETAGKIIAETVKDIIRREF